MYSDLRDATENKIKTNIMDNIKIEEKKSVLQISSYYSFFLSKFKFSEVLFYNHMSL